MRIPITFDKPLGLLVDGVSQPGTRRRVIETLVNSFLWEDARTFKEAISTASTSETKAFLSDVRDRLCWKTILDDPAAIHVIVADRSLSEILDSEEVSTALNSNSAILRSGESRQRGFDQQFKTVLRLATRVDILDTYASSNLMARNEGTVWFLSRVMENFGGVISILSQEPRDGVNAPAGVNAKRELMTANLEGLLRSCHSFEGEIRLTLVDSHIVPHNRRLGIRFDSGQATILLEKGLGIFDDDPFLESHELPNANLLEFKRVISLAANSRSKHEIVRRHFDVCQDCNPN